MRKYLLFALACAIVPVGAQAQGPSQAVTIDTVRKEARIHAGPLYLTPALQLKELGVDTNVYNTGADPKSDFTFTLTPKVDLWVPVARRLLISSTVASDVVWYAKYAGERSLNPQFTVRGEAYFRRLTFFAENAYLNTRQRPNFEIDLRSRHLENDSAVGADFRITPKVSIEGAAIRAVTRYDADASFAGTSLQRTLNRDTTGFRLVGRHKATPLTTVALRYENLADRFMYSPARNADSIRVMPGVEFKPRALVSGTAFVGYRRFTPQFPGLLPDFSGLVSQLGLSYTLLGSTTFGVSYRRDLTYSYEEFEPFFVNDSVGLSVRRAVGRRFDILVSADRHQYAYRNLLVQPALVGLAPERIDTTWAYAGSFGYRVGRVARVGFGLSYYDRTSTTRNFREFNGLRAGTVVSYGF